MKKTFLIFLVLFGSAFAQSKDANNILNNLKEAFNKVHDYTVNVDVKVDVNFLKAPDMKAKLFFKQPDKMHLESEGFAMLPRDGLFTSPMSFLNGSYTAIYVKDEEIDGTPTSEVKVIPLSDKGDLLLTTLWIDQKRNVIRKVESTTKTNGTFSLVMNYDSSMNYPLPSSMIFDFNSGERKKESQEQDMHGRRRRFDNISGKVTITYSDYVVNKGIPDSVFEAEKTAPSKK